MPQVINESTAGGNLGAAFGTGLGEGLQMLAQQKMSKMVGEQNRQRSLVGLSALGYDPQEAEAISYLDPELQKIAIKEKLRQPSQQAYQQGLSQLLGGNAGTESTGDNVPEAIQTGGLTEKQATELAKLGIQKQQHTEKQRASAYKETKEDRQTIMKSAKSARENDMRLNRIKELDKKGNIQNPLLYSALKKVGLDIPALKNADSQELDKLSNDFLKSAKDVFGSRLTNFDVQTFLSTVPSLSNTKEGRARVIRNLELFNKGALEREKAMRDILKENKGTPPLDLADRVEERVAPALDKIAQEFVSGVAASEGNLSVGSKLSSLPEPSAVPAGTRIKKKDGTVLENTGSQWKKVS